MRNEVVEKLESRENSCKIWLLNALQHSSVGKFPTEFSEFCGTGFNPHTDPALCGNTSSEHLDHTTSALKL